MEMGPIEIIVLVLIAGLGGALAPALTRLFLAAVRWAAARRALLPWVALGLAGAVALGGTYLLLQDIGEALLRSQRERADLRRQVQDVVARVEVVDGRFDNLELEVTGIGGLCRATAEPPPPCGSGWIDRDVVIETIVDDTCWKWRLCIRAGE